MRKGIKKLIDSCGSYVNLSSGAMNVSDAGGRPYFWLPAGAITGLKFHRLVDFAGWNWAKSAGYRFIYGSVKAVEGLNNVSAVRLHAGRLIGASWKVVFFSEDPMQGVGTTQHKAFSSRGAIPRPQSIGSYALE